MEMKDIKTSPATTLKGEEVLTRNGNLLKPERIDFAAGFFFFLSTVASTPDLKVATFVILLKRRTSVQRKHRNFDAHQFGHV